MHVAGPVKTANGQLIQYTVRYKNSSSEFTFFPITGPGGRADAWKRCKVNVKGKSRR